MKRNLLLFAAALGLGASLQAQALQRVIIEEHTGAWCGYCPDGALILDDILDAQPNVIGVSIHEGDAMQIAASSLIRSFFGPAFPQATINRQGDPISRGSWASAANAALAKSPLVSVSFDSVVYEPVTRVLTAKLKATFIRDTTGQMRFNLYVLEDEVSGTGSGYNQVNYFNTTNGHPMQGLGNPIVGYVHNHVFRECLGSAWGTVGAIPSTVLAGSEYTHTYTYTIPPYIDDTKVNLVAMVNYHGGQLTYQRPTLNSDEMPLSMAVGIEDGLTAASNEIMVWPNPSNHFVNVSFTVANMGNVRVEVYSTTGQLVSVVAEGFTNSGTHTVTWNGKDLNGNAVTDGLYFMRLSTEDGDSRTQRVVMQSF